MLGGILAVVLVGGLLVFGAWWWLWRTPAWHREAAPHGVLTPALVERSTFPPDDALRCKECHLEEYELWSGSQHAHANRLVSYREDQKAFNPARTYLDGDFETEVFQSWHDFVVRQVDPHGLTSYHQAVAVIGVEPLIQYLTPFPGGRLQTIDPAYDPARNEWFTVFPGENRQPHEWGFWKNQGMNWNSQCAFCHTTDFQKNYDALTDSYASTWKAMGISCSQCHGAMEEHLANPDAPVARFTPDQVMSNCASCHSRREELTGAFHPGETYTDHYSPALPDISEVYYPDGQVREENFEYASFITSRMGHAGVRCLDCHNAHSGKLLLPVENNAMCMSCHTPPGTDGATPIPDPVAHSHHPGESTGNRCVECHMPETTYMARDPRRDHGFSIPDPQLTLRYGIPNACNRCHTDESAEWANEWVEKWYGDKMQRPSRERALALAAARRGEPGSIDRLIPIIESEEIPAWRAGLLTALGGALHVPAVRQLVQTAAGDPDPLVRAAAQRLIPPSAGMDDIVQAGLSDPRTIVRLAAATPRALSGEPLPDEVLEEVRRLIRYQSDSPVGALRTAQLAQAEGRERSVREWLARAVALDPSPGMWSEVAMSQYRLGDLDAARASFSEALAQDPKNGEVLYSLALLEGEAGRDPVPYLRRAVEAEPGFGRAWYNLGLAEAAAGRLAEAVGALRHAEELMPGVPDAPYALATVYLRLNEPEKARSAARRAISIDPLHAPARRLLGQ